MTSFTIAASVSCLASQHGRSGIHFDGLSDTYSKLLTLAFLLFTYWGYRYAVLVLLLLFEQSLLPREGLYLNIHIKNFFCLNPKRSRRENGILYTYLTLAMHNCIFCK